MQSDPGRCGTDHTMAHRSHTCFESVLKLLLPRPPRPAWAKLLVLDWRGRRALRCLGLHPLELVGVLFGGVVPIAKAVVHQLRLVVRRIMTLARSRAAEPEKRRQ